MLLKAAHHSQQTNLSADKIDESNVRNLDKPKGTVYQPIHLLLCSLNSMGSSSHHADNINHLDCFDL
jgi:hypothetical protein